MSQEEVALELNFEGSLVGFCDSGLQVSGCVAIKPEDYGKGCGLVCRVPAHMSLFVGSMPSTTIKRDIVIPAFGGRGRQRQKNQEFKAILC